MLPNHFVKGRHIECDNYISVLRFRNGARSRENHISCFIAI